MAMLGFSDPQKGLYSGPSKALYISALQQAFEIEVYAEL